MEYSQIPLLSMLSTNSFTKPVWCSYAHLLPLTLLPASVKVGVPQDFYMEGQWFGVVKPLLQVETSVATSTT